MSRSFKQYVPQDISELSDMVAMMVMSSPRFQSDYFADQNLDTVFSAFSEGLGVAKDELGSKRYQLLIDLVARARALFRGDLDDKNGGAQEGQKILWQIEEILSGE